MSMHPAGTGPPPDGIQSLMMANSNACIASAPPALSGNGAAMGEEISTIFVVGFPDDMQEREFQNMFTFSPGFEAATLKSPSKEQEDDNGRKQTIGFAKFRTRFEALEARDVLNGRKVDAEKGSVLKAEMAKKNLHTKRGLSIDPYHPGPAASSCTGSTRRYSLSISTTTTTTTPSHAAAYEAFHSVPPALPSDRNPPNPDFYPDLLSPGGTPVFTESVFAPSTSRSASAGDLFLPRLNTRNGEPEHHHHAHHRFMPATVAQQQQQQQQQQQLHTLPEEDPADGPSLDARLNGLSISTSATTTSNGGLPSPGITSPTNCFRSFAIPPPPLPPPPAHAATGAAISADQNPPCNTLYVGNLPHNASEDELRNMFAQCPGYQRLSFRSKLNGPMCFVEFDDVACASQAMQDLQGKVLSNSVKGGIRLSFSKNPLGVRPDGRRESQPTTLALFDQQLS